MKFAHRGFVCDCRHHHRRCDRPRSGHPDRVRPAARPHDAEKEKVRVTLKFTHPSQQLDFLDGEGRPQKAAVS